MGVCSIRVVVLCVLGLGLGKDWGWVRLGKDSGKLQYIEGRWDMSTMHMPFLFFGVNQASCADDH